MEYDRQVQLKDYNSFQTEALAKIFCRPQTVEELRQCLSDHPDEKKLIIGGGCNLFFTRDFDGLVICLDMKGMRKTTDDDEDDDSDDIYIEVMASEDWDTFVSYCVDRGFAGLENLSLIPGTVGAAPVQNIGAYGAEVKDCIREVIAMDIDTGEVISFSNTECEFAYRDSLFKRSGQYIIISVVFELKRTFVYTPKYGELNRELEEIVSPSIKDVRDAVLRIRQRKLPNEKVLPNAGSFFKNPVIDGKLAKKLKDKYHDLPVFPQSDGRVKTSAAYFIDQAGYKGMRIGDIGTYPSQPLILVNYGSKDGNDIINFMKEIQIGVSNAFGVDLEPEVRIF